jgi:hypothetical protein
MSWRKQQPTRQQILLMMMIKIYATHFSTHANYIYCWYATMTFTECVEMAFSAVSHSEGEILLVAVTTSRIQTLSICLTSCGQFFSLDASNNFNNCSLWACKYPIKTVKLTFWEIGKVNHWRRLRGPYLNTAIILIRYRVRAIEKLLHFEEKKRQSLK